MDSKKNLKLEFIGLNNFREIYKGLILLFRVMACVLYVWLNSLRSLDDLKLGFVLFSDFRANARPSKIIDFLGHKIEDFVGRPNLF